MSLKEEYERGRPQESVDAALVEALRKKVNTLEARIDELEAQSDGTENGEGSEPRRTGRDGRDQAVLDELDAGEVVSLRRLQGLYRTHTDIRSERTLKNRVRSLTKRSEFEQAAHAKWRYIGGEGK
jgi:hypothetical protein